MNERLMFPQYIGYTVDNVPDKVANLIGKSSLTFSDVQTLKFAFSQYMKASNENFINGIKLHPDYEIIRQVATIEGSATANNPAGIDVQTGAVSKTNEILQKFVSAENLPFAKGAILVILAVVFIKYITKD